jgi:hypothetical protein
MTIDLDTLHLSRGGHFTRARELCLLEAAAYLAGEEHSDHPACVSPVLGIFGRDLNDCLDDAKRQHLKPMIFGMLNTAGDGLDEVRGYLALDWLTRTYAPAWMELGNMPAVAAELRATAPVVNLATARKVGAIIQSNARRASIDADNAQSAGLSGAHWATTGGIARSAAEVATTVVASAGAEACAWLAAWRGVWAIARAAPADRRLAAADQLQDSAIELFAAMVKPPANGAER